MWLNATAVSLPFSPLRAAPCWTKTRSNSDLMHRRLILPHMTVGNGLLSKLQINGQAVDIPGSGMMSGGVLSAQFELRDIIAPQAQTRLDAIARDAIERFGPGGPDTTLALGDAGVFTDAGSALTTANETGLAGRMSLNSALSSSSADPWRWRDGINALSEGDAGQAGLLLALQSRMSLARIPGSPALGTSPAVTCRPPSGPEQ